MKLKNAGIKKGDWEEAARRIMDGELLYTLNGGEDWQVEVHWTQALPQFCWVWTDPKDKYRLAMEVIDYVESDDYPYKVRYGHAQKDAELFDLSKSKIGELK